MKADFFILFIGFSLILSSCEFFDEFEKGNGRITTVSREVGDFSKIRVGGNFEVLLTEGNEPWIRLIMDENLVSFITTEIIDNTLIIQQEKKLISKQKIKIVISYDKLSELRLTGAALIHNEDTLKQENLNIRMDGAGMIDLTIKTSFLKVLLSGAGVVKLSGETEGQELELTGAGSLRAFDLRSNVCKVTVSGLGGAKINVMKELDAKIEGLGGIDYSGDPSNVRTEVNGLGEIKQIENY